MQFDLVEFRAVVERNRANRQNRNFPDRTDDRAVDGCLFPRITPKFTLDFSKPLKVFTIGSCFARNIEDVLLKRGVTLPTAAVRTPKGEMPHGRLVLNEFTPGTMAQRIQYGLNAQPFSLESLVPSGDDRVADLLLHGLTNKTKFDVSYERGVERRGQIDAIYRELRTADVVILTLGFVEAWFDAHTNLYLNRVPPMHFAARNPGRFHLVRLDVHQSLSLLDGAIRMLSDLSIKTILTISPVPLHTTFTPVDCVIANEYSKSVLRVCADELCRRYDSVDYFPSYEIVRSGGLQNFVEDNVHVKEEVVALIADYMMSMYSMDAQDISVLAAVSAEAVTGKPQAWVSVKGTLSPDLRGSAGCHDSLAHNRMDVTPWANQPYKSSMSYLGWESETGSGRKIKRRGGRYGRGLTLAVDLGTMVNTAKAMIMNTIAGSMKAPIAITGVHTSASIAWDAPFRAANNSVKWALPSSNPKGLFRTSLIRGRVDLAGSRADDDPARDVDNIAARGEGATCLKHGEPPGKRVSHHSRRGDYALFHRRNQPRIVVPKVWREAVSQPPNRAR